jgi:hypothetical protein
MATNWVQDLFNIIQESNGNIKTEDGLYLCLQEFDSTVWVIDTTTGSG